jgi:hypothetical protein
VSRRNECAVCGIQTDAIYRLCLDCLRDRTVAEREAQGLPPTINDPAQLRKVAHILHYARRGKAS